MFELFHEMWGFAFMRRAFVATTVLSASVAPVGAFLVLRRLSLAGEAMAHAITPGIVIGFVTAGLSVMSLLIGGLIAGVGVAVLTALLARRTILRSDASLASLYLIALAVGIFILSAAGSAVPLKSFLFGSILGIDDASMLLVGGVATVTLVSFAFLLRPLIVSTCDPVFFETQTKRPWLIEQGFMLLLVLNLLAAFKTLGTLMAVGLMILPATAARYWASTITAQLFLGSMFALSSCWIGLTLSYLFPETPSGPAIVLVAGAFFLVSAIFGPLGFGGRLRKPSVSNDIPVAQIHQEERAK
ncbi:zinc ABC transporter permease [Ruegeria sp. ANG-S4]|uniref:metal ABC transporter permease n=1 Tax=Ruegeria sp. ANG-S4 TaxID=1577904 RepID=UPI00057F91E8|nr:metal ABC transporter permease [Ruegeria sp. ANG-S4]KIC45717.1 zinc ABC transporter permease [Ruegeria sp. ANG-S4]